MGDASFLSPRLAERRRRRATTMIPPVATVQDPRPGRPSLPSLSRRRVQPPPLPGPLPRPAADPGAGARTVLVAEDDESIRKLIVRLLGREHRVYEAADGHLAIGLLARIETPDVIVLDVMMPGVDGLDVAAQIKADPKLGRVPIIFLTAFDGSLDVIRGIQAGARHYISKPFAMDDLLEKVRGAARPGG